MNQLNIIEGGCLCGHIRYKITCEPINPTMCHCSDCRKACGAQSVAWVTASDPHFCFTQGNPQTYQSSTNVERTFCPICGTSLTYRVSGKNETDVTVGSLDHPEHFPPTKDLHCRDRLQWGAPSTNRQVE